MVALVSSLTRPPRLCQPSSRAQIPARQHPLIHHNCSFKGMLLAAQRTVVEALLNFCQQTFQMRHESGLRDK